MFIGLNKFCSSNTEKQNEEKISTHNLKYNVSQAVNILCTKWESETDRNFFLLLGSRITDIIILYLDASLVARHSNIIYVHTNTKKCGVGVWSLVLFK